MFERSLMTILYFPALSDVTLVLPFLRVIVKPGPSVPVRVGTAAEAEATNTSAAPSSATRARRVRNILLLVEWFRPQNFCRENGSGDCSGQALSTADLIAATATGLVLGVEELGLERVTLLIVAVPLLPSLLERHRELEDARPLHVEDVEAHAVVHDRVALLRLAAEQPEDEAGHRVVVLSRHRRLEALVEVVDRKRSVDHDGVLVDLLDRFVRKVELILDVADDLLEQVFEGDDSLHVSVLVDDDGHVLVRAAKLAEQGSEILRLRDDVSRPDDVFDLDLVHASV